MRLIDADEIRIKPEYMHDICGSVMIRVEDVARIINEMPTINPKPHWIPCSERLPEEKDARILKKLGINKKSDYVIATVEAKGERMTVITCTYDGAWYWNKKHVFPDFKVVAWKPLPEPYQEEVNGQ